MMICGTSHPEKGACLQPVGSRAVLVLCFFVLCKRNGGWDFWDWRGNSTCSSNVTFYFICTFLSSPFQLLSIVVDFLQAVDAILQTCSENQTIQVLIATQAWSHNHCQIKGKAEHTHTNTPSPWQKISWAKNYFRVLYHSLWRPSTENLWAGIAQWRSTGPGIERWQIQVLAGVVGEFSSSRLLYVLSLISVSIPPLCYHSIM